MRDPARTLPLALAVVFGVLTLIGLLFVEPLAGLLTGWASFLAAVAVLLGIVNLLDVHGRRLVKGNVYSAVLVIGIVAVIALAITDELGLTDQWFNAAYDQVLVPLEAALASLLAFFLLFAGVRLLRRQRSGWALLFIVTVIVLLLSRAPMPEAVGQWAGRVGGFVSDVFVNAGMRGILIGVALGAVTIALRVLTGSERPYEK
ncbi:MAG: hypothetical protein ACWGPS_01165 [Candidatus Promineifilaceae bacterium]